jgi:pimeloyl-ACP methyl ester carboxylesterase
MEFAAAQFADVGGRRLAYEEVGPADPQGSLLLLCGLGAKRQGRYRQLPVLGERFRAIAVDYRDVGESDLAETPYSIGDLAEDTYALAGELGLERASLVGISMGGFIAVELALARRAFVEIARHRPMTADAYLRQLAACRSHDVADRLGDITAPTLVIHGDSDPLVPLENGRLLAAGIPGARLIVYPGIGHIPEVECFERFNADLIAFLS